VSRMFDHILGPMHKAKVVGDYRKCNHHETGANQTQDDESPSCWGVSSSEDESPFRGSTFSSVDEVSELFFFRRLARNRFMGNHRKPKIATTTAAISANAAPIADIAPPGPK